MTRPKRKSTDSAPSTRASKVAKTERQSKSSTKKGAKKTGVGIAAETFKATALPVHVNLTHTPPTIADPDTEAVSVTATDPGLIGNLTCVPSVFSTGSFGWKGSTRTFIELENPQGGEKQKVQVILSVNATVLGSKPSKSDEGDKKVNDDDEGDSAEEEAEATGDD